MDKDNIDLEAEREGQALHCQGKSRPDAYKRIRLGCDDRGYAESRFDKLIRQTSE